MTDRSMIIASTVINVVLCCTTIMLNIVTVHALRKTSQALPNNVKTVLLSLSVADLGVGLLVQPLYIALQVIYLREQSYQNYPTSLMTYNILMNLLCLASILNVTVLSADRFLAIHLHLRYHELVTHKRLVAAVISIWVSAVFIALIELWKKETMPYIIGIISIVCLTTTAFFSYQIYLVLRRHANDIQEMQVQQTAQNDAVMENHARQKISAAAVFYVYLVLLVCYLPNICIIAVILILNPVAGEIPTIITICVDMLIFLNSSLNPLIYCWKIKHIRHTIKDELRNINPCHD